jgi:ubiquinone/menaquinone biosynthesis C-methylase UbiE
MSNIESRPEIVRIDEPLTCCDEIWEAAYLRFETPEEEKKKFVKRLYQLGVESWPKHSMIVDLFCGRGNGINALKELGFNQIEGLDLSERLLLQFQGDAKLYVCDCRKLPFDDASRDIVIVQGGVHHLPNQTKDFEAVILETRRVLKPEGRFVMVEPWRTPFLDFVHFMTKFNFFRKLYPPLDDLAIMTDRERTTYEAWLKLPREIEKILLESFQPEIHKKNLGKIFFVGRKKD